MNLTKLFETQKTLDQRIIKQHGLEGQDLLPQKILALQVELGECANEWRGFKFWSKDREPRTEAYSHHEEKQHGRNGFSSIAKYEKNPLLEEYVDCLHFILSIGIEINLTDISLFDTPKTENINYQFLNVFGAINNFIDYMSVGNYRDLFSVFITLGKQLGFTWEQIEQAYYSKNEINHTRQDTGY